MLQARGQDRPACRRLARDFANEVLDKVGERYAVIMLIDDSIRYLTGQYCRELEVLYNIC